MESIPKIPNLQLAQARFIWAHPSASPDQKTAAKVLLESAIKEANMSPLYHSLLDQFPAQLVKNPDLVKTMQEANEAELSKLDDRLADASKNLGETEISDALIAKADFLTKIGDKDAAITAYRAAYDKTGPLGARIDMVFTLIRIGFFYADLDLITRNIDKVKSLIEEGGDWDRRNRLKVYEGIHKMSIRDFKGAATLLLDSLATFTSTELMEYKEFVTYTVLSAAITLPRPELKKKVIDAPEVLEVIHELPHLQDYINSLYKGEYDLFFRSLAAIEQDLKLDRWISAHYQYYVREMQIIAYSQLLESYRSVTISSVADHFGVSEDFIDRQLSSFIASGRLNAVIDKVAGIVETNRPDAKNAQYQASIKQGDLLLNRIQKLGRVIAL
ncbi:hypothetical protein SeMB42_g05478 [Synchytrium endobioticum]|uniref:PCI domain-containing protein n=1 Tax=Synchytrium endobioticum TaxID=286115 RepID=A0A507CR70_9FUNG|nr:hypothetical protein SeMB42_g05478 [Synchytrium endobioticum]TPX49318.1 hypothetical protein SeLEV6574_g01544 [Synchytrium endobioticum]